MTRLDRIGIATMTTAITGALATLAAIAFLGWLAYDVGEVPLWIVVIIGIAGMVVDFIGTLTHPESESR